MLLGNCVYVALKGGKLHLDLWTAVTRAERADVPVDPADSSRILWFHSDWQGTVCRVAQEKPVIMTGWSEPRRRRWKKKPKKKEGEGRRRRKKGVGALYHTHMHARHCSSPHLQGNLCSHAHRLFFFFFTEDLSKLYHQRWRKGRENWKKTDKWKCIPSSLTICQLHFPFIWRKDPS